MTSSKRLIQRSFKVDDETRGRLAGPPGPAGPDLSPISLLDHAFCLRSLSWVYRPGLWCSADEKTFNGRELTAVLTILQLHVEAGWRAHSEQPWA